MRILARSILLVYTHLLVLFMIIHNYLFFNMLSFILSCQRYSTAYIRIRYCNTYIIRLPLCVRICHIHYSYSRYETSKYEMDILNIELIIN